MTDSWGERREEDGEELNLSDVTLVGKSLGRKRETRDVEIPNA